MSQAPSDKRLIEVAFPLKQASIDSVHEKNVRHGHISTLHIWPARRPLAASRAALIATLLPDPGDKTKRDEILKRLGGTLKKTLKKKKMPNGRTEEIEALETEGGVLHWGNESSPDMDWFRAEIRKAYGGRAPKVLDPFAGGGAIPLEAMRLGCEVTAVDINPVAWFILKCTLEYPQKLAGQKRRLPDFVLADEAFLTDYFKKAKGLTKAESTKRARRVAKQAETVRHENGELFAAVDLAADELDADLAWHVRAWGRWVLKEARRDLAKFYPTYAEYCSLEPYHRVELDTGAALKLVPVNAAGEPQVELLNTGFDAAYLENPKNPRWVAKPTVAYLWARTVRCKGCHATVPLLKTRWLAKKDKKRVLLTMQSRVDKTGVEFGIDAEAKSQGGNAAQRREYDKKLGGGTMSRAGARCPCCGTVMTMEDLRLEGRAGRTAEVMTSVVTDGHLDKEYRLPTAQELTVAAGSECEIDAAYEDIPFGVPNEPIERYGKRGGSYGFPIVTHGISNWRNLFTARQLVSIAKLIRGIRGLRSHLGGDPAYVDALQALLAIALDRTANYLSRVCIWESKAQEVKQTFLRYALPMSWDFAEGNPLAPNDRFFHGAISNVGLVVESLTTQAFAGAPTATVVNQSAMAPIGQQDVVVTDPPYYDAIPYSDLMDFFYIWLKRALHGLSPQLDAAFQYPLAPKWNHDEDDGELIDDSSRFNGDKSASKQNYEEGMARVFQRCQTVLGANGRLVIVFAHKQPDAWETLVNAIIKAGFVVDGSWPIATEMRGGVRNHGRASLASSVWLVCRKRDPLTKAGWDAQVLKDMRAGITAKLRDFWDAGIRGPDFVWAATGPAMEAYSRYPAVKKASEPGQLMSVTEFLGHVRRMVVDFVVGRVLSRGEDGAATNDQPLDDITTYYLLHRHDFGLDDAPAGPCILYAVSCGLSERELVDQYEVLARSGKASSAEDDDEDPGEEGDGDATDSGDSGGGKFKLKPWNARKHRSLGTELPSGRAIPMIDQVHKLMQLWEAGDMVKVNDYLDARGLRRTGVFAQLVQALIEKSREERSEKECSILERVQNHLKAVGSTAQSALGLQ